MTCATVQSPTPRFPAATRAGAPLRPAAAARWAVAVAVLSLLAWLAPAALGQQPDDTDDSPAARVLRQLVEQADRLATSHAADDRLQAFRLLMRADSLAGDAATTTRLRARRIELGSRLLDEAGTPVLRIREIALQLLADDPLRADFLRPLLPGAANPALLPVRQALLRAHQRLVDGDAAAAARSLSALRTVRLASHVAQARDVLYDAAMAAWANSVAEQALADWTAGNHIAVVNRVAQFRRSAGQSAVAPGSALDALDRSAREQLGLPGDPTADDFDPLAAGLVLVRVNDHGHREYTRPRDGATLIEVAPTFAKLGTNWSSAFPEALRPRALQMTRYLIDATEVTNASYARFLNATRAVREQAGRLAVDDWIRPHPFGLLLGDDGWWRPASDPQTPVVNVTWAGAMAYAAWVGGTLPDEYQWELAARGTDGRPYPWGFDGPQEADPRVAWRGSTLGRPLRVGQTPGGASPCGALDMAGNVWEWTTPLPGAADSVRVIRGGSCRSDARELAAWHRSVERVDARYANLGFRCAFAAGSQATAALDAEPPSPGAQPPMRQFNEPEPDARPLPAEFAELLTPVSGAPGPYPVFTRKTDGARVVQIPAGRVAIGDLARLGDPSTPHNDPPDPRWLWLPGYLIDAGEVSNGQYATFLNAVEPTAEELARWVDLRSPTSQLDHDGVMARPMPGTDDLPVTMVSHAGARAYSLWAWGDDPRTFTTHSYLPTVAQWERAAAWDVRAGRKWQYPWGDDLPAGLSQGGAHVAVNVGVRTDDNSPFAWHELPLWPVFEAPGDAGSMRFANAPPLWHLVGNVREWLANPGGLDPVPGVLATEPDPPASHWIQSRARDRGVPDEDREFAVRGGSFRSTHVNQLRVTTPDSARDATFADDLGFRTARPSGVGPAIDPGLLLPPARETGPDVPIEPRASLVEVGRNASGYLVVRRAKDNAEMIVIPGGPFRMGADPAAGDAAPDHAPAHEVQLTTYLIDRLEVTNRQFVAFLNDEVARRHAAVQAGERTGLDIDELIWPDETTFRRIEDEPPRFEVITGDDQPVVQVTWFGATAYARWVGGMLPSEAQWEKAARGPVSANQPDGPGVPYPWGDALPDESRAIALRRGRSRGPLPVGDRKAGESPYGVRDMAGNVWEWVQDWYSPATYRLRATLDDALARRDPSGALPSAVARRVNRGGGFRSQPDALRVWARAADAPEAAYDSLGFRCAMPAHRLPNPPDDLPVESEPR